jgi:hypothetical protein
VTNKIRYPRTTLEICAATLAVLREGLGFEFHRNYPELTCYNGRQWVDGMNELSLYYTKARFHAMRPRVGLEEYDVRMVIVRNSNESRNQGLPMFWCAVWYRIGEVVLLSKPAEYAPRIHQGYFHVPRWGGEHEPVTEFDPTAGFSDLEMIRQSEPPQPIKF